VPPAGARVADLRTQLSDALSDRYRLERELGRGGMATVFLAHDLRHKRSVALKILHPELAQTLGPDRFRREIETAARLQHPHILTVLDSGEAVGQLWFTMPYVEGESLRDRLRRETQLPVEDALRIATDAARALEYAHQHGVVHRDIKPENLLLTQDGSTLVADFGIARALSEGGDQLTQTGMSIGTPAYMSPEQAVGDRNLDARTDVYSLGTVLYEMLAGEPPFTGPTAQAIIAKRFKGDVPQVRQARSAVSESVERAIARALAPLPADRFVSAAEFARALTTSITVPDEPAASLKSAQPPATVTAPTGARRRRRVPVAATAMGLGFLLGLGVLFAWSRGIGTGRPVERRPVLLADFSTRGADSTLAAIVTEALRSDLSQSPAVILLSSDRVEEALARSGRDRKTPVDLALGRQLAQREGALAVVAGDVSEVGGPVLLTARIVDPASGEDLGAVRETASDSTAVLAAIDRLSQSVRKRLGESTRSLKSAPPLARATTSSVDALRKYTQALALKENAGTEVEATALLEDAVKLDTGFALAWRELAEMRSLPSGRWDAMRRAMSHRDRLAPSERAFTEATYYEFVGDFEPAITALRNLVKLDPGNTTAWGNLSWLLLYRAADDQGGLDAARKALVASGHAAGRFGPVIDAEMANGHVDAARRVLDSLRAVAPDSFEQVMAQVAWSSHWGDYEAADSIVEGALRRSQGNVTLTATWERVRRNLLLLQGKVNQAEAHHRRFIDYLAKAGRPERALANEFAFAQLLTRLNGPGPAIERRLDDAMRRFPPEKMNPLDPGYFFMASSAAWSRRSRWAKEMLSRWSAAQPADGLLDSIGIYWALGDIALSEGRYEESARLHGRAGDLSPGAENYFPHRGHPHDLLGHADSAIALYKRYLDRVAQLQGRLMWLDPAHLSETYEALGRNYENVGQPDSSAKYYQALLDLWKNADPELEPKKKSLRTALARVTAEKGSQVPLTGVTPEN
jgi:eukaryotic-like serine/threonine-protein kinase